MSPIPCESRLVVKLKLKRVSPKKELSIALNTERINVDEKESKNTIVIRKTIPISLSFSQR
jgi:hypothetical protein